MTSHTTRHQDELVHRAEIVVYAAITLQGVIVAASWKNYLTSFPELLTIILGTSMAITAAHFWSSLVAHRLVHEEIPRQEIVYTEMRIAVSFFVTAGIAIAAALVGLAIFNDFNSVVYLTNATLVAVLFTLGLIGAKAAERTWGRAIAWGLLDASMGFAILAIKVLFGS